MIGLLNRFLRWLAPKPRQWNTPVYTEGEYRPVTIDDILEAKRREERLAMKIDVTKVFMETVTLGDYARMSADAIVAPVIRISSRRSPA